MPKITDVSRALGPQAASELERFNKEILLRLDSASDRRIGSFGTMIDLEIANKNLILNENALKYCKSSGQTEMLCDLLEKRVAMFRWLIPTWNADKKYFGGVSTFGADGSAGSL